MPVGSYSFPAPPQPYHPEVNVIELMKVLIAQKGSIKPIRNEMVRQLELQHFTMKLDVALDSGRTPGLAEEIANKQSVLEQHIRELEKL